MMMQIATFIIMEHSETPKHFELLDEADKVKYKKLQAYFIAHSMSAKNCGNSAFQDSLIKIHAFCVRNDEDDWKRSVVCGICWFRNSILLSVQQLQKLLGKSKSSINGSLHKLGYMSCGPRVTTSDVVSEIPFFNTCIEELRRWTWRRMYDVITVESSQSESDFEIPELCTEPDFDCLTEPLEDETL